MKKIKLSELPLYQSLKGLFTIGTNENNESVRVPLEFIEKSTNEANDAAESANNAAKNANEAAGSANKAAGDANAAAGAIFNELKKYIPRSLIGAINGVASLDAAGKILAAALNMPWRGNFTGNFQASNVEPGIYGVDDRKIGPNPLNGENAHGVMLVFPDRYKTTLFLVGRPNGSQYGNAPEIYARRWLETAKSWTSWFTTANYAKKSDIPTGFRVTRFYSTEKTSGLHMPESTPYEPFVDKDGTPIVLEEGVLYVLEEDLPYSFQRGDIFQFDPTAPKQYEEGYNPLEQIGRLRCIVNKSSINTTYEEMTEYEAKKGVNTVGKLITAAVLKSAIKEHAPAEDLSTYAKKTDLPSLRTLGASEDNIEIEAGGRKNVQFPLDIPDDYTIGAYRGVGLQGTTNDAEGFHKCAIQSFSTAGGGTMANISIKNFGDAAVKVKLNVEVLCFKQ